MSRESFVIRDQLEKFLPLPGPALCQYWTGGRQDAEVVDKQHSSIRQHCGEKPALAAKPSHCRAAIARVESARKAQRG